MVSAVQDLTPEKASHRLISILKETGLPGEDSDHQWIASRLQHHAESLSHVHSSQYVADLLVSGILIERGLDPSKSKYLAGRGFPEACLRSAPKLLQIGCPKSTWELIEAGILSYQGTVWGKTDRWVLHGSFFRSVTDTCHELGRHAVMNKIARGVIPLLHDSGSPVQIQLTGMSRDQGRRCLDELTSQLHRAAPNHKPHLFLG
jgi:hypothetical protein